MKVALSTLALVFVASAAAQYTIESKPFHLILTSNDPSYSGETISLCHSGAGIETLCLSNHGSQSKPDPLPPSIFHFNTSDSVVTPNETLGKPGILTYWLETPDLTVPSSVYLYTDLTSNLALPLMETGWSGATVMSFDQDDFLNIQGYIDNTANPPKPGDYKAYYRFYSCTTYYASYTYTTLAWALGAGEPENPTCVKVGVQRKFI